MQFFEFNTSYEKIFGINVETSKFFEVFSGKFESTTEDNEERLSTLFKCEFCRHVYSQL